MEELIRTITESISGWIQALGGGFVGYIADNIDYFNVKYTFGDTNTDLDKEMWLWILYRRVLFLSWIVLFLRLIVDGLRAYLARETGEGMISPMILFRRLLMTVACMTVVTYVFAYGHHGISSTMGSLIKKYAKEVSNNPSNLPSPYTGAGWYPNMGDWLSTFKSNWVDSGAGGSSNTPTNPGEVIFRVGIALTVTMGILAFFVQQALRELELVFAWLVGPLACLSALTTDEPWREGALSLWLREVLVVSFNQVSTMVVLLMMYELIDLERLKNLNSGLGWTSIVTILALIAIGTQGPRALRHYAWGNQQGQALASQLIKMPW